MGVRVLDVLALTLVILSVTNTAVSVDLATLLKHKHKIPIQKKNNDGNPCPEPEKPFPCKESTTCIPMGYVCDDNYDCEDGYDEDPEVCTAVHRPPVQDIIHFLQSEEDWLMPLFEKNIGKIAHGLAVSQTLNDFRRRVDMSDNGMMNLKLILDAVKHHDEAAMEDLGMPSSAWGEVSFFFGKLIKSGFYS